VPRSRFTPAQQTKLNKFDIYKCFYWGYSVKTSNIKLDIIDITKFRTI